MDCGAMGTVWGEAESSRKERRDPFKCLVLDTCPPEVQCESDVIWYPFDLLVST